MSAPRSMDAQPDAAFADALEARLLAALTHRAAASGHHDPQEDLMTVDLQERTRRAPDTGRSRWWLVAAALALVGLVGVVLAFGRVTDDSAGEARSVSFEMEWPNLPDVESKECIPELSTDRELPVSGNCLRTFFGPVGLSGAIEGTGAWGGIAGRGWTDDPTDATVTEPATYNMTYLVAGEVAGCGRGEFVLLEVLRFQGWSAGQFVGTWTIVDGSGKGGLTTISGSGTSPGEPGPDPSSTRTLEGTITC